MVSSVRTPLLVMLGAVGFVVLIACINVANLLLVRALARRKETSVRFALGATRVRIVREFLVESLIISLLGCVSGSVLGEWLLRWLVFLAPASIPRLNEARLDWRVFAVSAVLATLTGILFGCIPAWQASQAKPVDALRGHGHSGGAQTMRWRSALTIAEIALSMVLLTGAGLLLRSFAGLSGVDLGFQPERILAMSVNLPDARYHSADERLRFFERLEERVRTLPGVAAVAYANRMPLRGGWSSGFSFAETPDCMHEAEFQAVSAGYFETIGIQLVSGRGVSSADRSGQPSIAVVNLAFSRRLLGGHSALGTRFRRGPNAPWLTVVGVVNDIRRGGKSEEINPQVYLSAAQTEVYPVRLADLAIRSGGDPKALAKSIQGEVLAMDKDQPVTAVRTLDEIVSSSLAQRKFQLVLLLLFASAALGLALIGIFGVVAHLVEQRTPELGIRLALGASQTSILGMILKQAGVLVGIGVVAGIAGALVFSRSIASLLFGIAPTDWITYAVAAAALTLVSLAASAIPARRASRVDPVIAIRYE
jgi:putative ABC transport system permease protein